MNTVANKKVQYLSLIEAGYSPADAARSLGYSRSIGSAWAQNDAEFRARFAALRLAAANNAHNAGTELSQAIVAQSTLTLQQLAMQRLERELRTDGPNAVLAAAAIVLVSPQATPVDSPVLEDETSNEADVVPDELQLVSLQSETPSMALSRMLNEVFPLNAPCTYSVDASHARHHIERYYNCNLEVEMQLSSKSISNVLRHHLTERFSIVFEPHLRSHGARIYAVPQPVTLF